MTNSTPASDNKNKAAAQKAGKSDKKQTNKSNLSDKPIDSNSPASSSAVVDNQSTTTSQSVTAKATTSSAADGNKSKSTDAKKDVKDKVKDKHSSSDSTPAQQPTGQPTLTLPIGDTSPVLETNRHSETSKDAHTSETSNNVAKQAHSGKTESTLETKTTVDKTPPSSSANHTAPNTAATEKVQEQTVKPSVSSSSANTNSHSSNTGTILGSISLALVIALGGYLYYQQNQQTAAPQLNMVNAQDDAIKSLSVQLADLKNSYEQLLATRGAMSQLQQQVNNELHQQQQAIDAVTFTNQEQAKQFAQLQTKVSSIMATANTDANLWLLAESNFLVKQAVRKLNNDHDISTAITLLLSADANLAALNDPSLNTIRSAINRDLSTLRGIAPLDTDGIIIKLQQLSEQVNQLSLPKTDNILMTTSDDTPAELTDSVSDWRQNLSNSWKSFVSGFITVKQRNAVDDKDKPELTANQSAYLHENIRMQLLIAAQAVPLQQQVIYQQALDKALSWVKTYYHDKESTTQSFITELETLSKLDIKQSIPTELTSQPLIDKVVQNRVKNLLTKSSSSD